MEASAEKKDSYLSLSRLTAAEGVGIVFALIFGISLFLPWFTTSDTTRTR